MLRYALTTLRLFGKPPFGFEPAEVLSAIALFEVGECMPMVRGDFQMIPAALRSIVSACLRNDEDARPTATEVLATVKSALDPPAASIARDDGQPDGLDATTSASTLSGAATCSPYVAEPAALVSKAMNDPDKRAELSRAILRWLEPSSTA